MDFFDNAVTYSNHASNITCCHPNNTFEVATCGQGASCAGQCSALGASLCPSGDCTDDPRTIVAKKRDPGILDPELFLDQIRKVEARLGKLAKIRKVETD